MALAITTFIVLEGSILFISLFTRWGLYVTYPFIIIFSLVIGLIISLIIHKLTQDDKQIITISLASIIPSSLVVAIILKIIKILSNGLAEISTNSVGGSSNLASMFNAAVPHYIAAAVLIFLCFNAIFFVEFAKKKDLNAFAYYFAALLTVIALAIIISEFILSEVLFP